MDIEKLTPVPNDLAKLSNVVKNDVVKKTEYNKLVGKVDNIDTTDFVPDTSSLVKKQITVLKLLKWRVKYIVLVV